jgi:hypothetical protein
VINPLFNGLLANCTIVTPLSDRLSLNVKLPWDSHSQAKPSAVSSKHEFDLILGLSIGNSKAPSGRSEGSNGVAKGVVSIKAVAVTVAKMVEGLYEILACDLKD